MSGSLASSKGYYHTDSASQETAGCAALHNEVSGHIHTSLNVPCIQQSVTDESHICTSADKNAVYNISTRSI